MVNEDTWEEFMVKVPGTMGFDVSVCGLCGNTGMIDTSKSPPVTPYGVTIVPIRKPCICKNGRFIKEERPSNIES